MRRRIAAILATTALLAITAAVPAAAQDDPELDPYAAGADATALEILLAGQGLAFSVTGAGVSSEPTAIAQGAAVLVTGEDLTTAATPGNPPTAEDCALDEELPAPIDLAGLALGCVDLATAADPSAMAASEELGLAVNSAEIVGQASEAVLRPLLEELLGGLAPVIENLPAPVGTSLDTLITLLLADLENGGEVASISVAPTSSEASEIAGTSTSQGVVVELLPDLLPGVGPLATIVVGDAHASATVEPSTGDVVLDGEAAFLDVDLSGLEVVLNALLDGVGGALSGELPPPLDVLTQELIDEIVAAVVALDDEVESLVNVTVDQLACTPENPLIDLLCFAAGGVNELDAEAAAALGYDFGPGTRGIQAEVLDLALLNALGDDALLALSVGSATAAASATVAPDAPRGPSAPAPEPTLPRTGGEAGLPLTLGLLGAALAGLALVRRTRTA